ncbi:MAG: response regulator, partial [Deltaproteobacteria bacterium]|nr:response regulator [Deltaproteobacteria bacterium]
TRQIPVIFLSAIDEPNQRVEGLQRGALDYLSKPFEAEELLARVHNHLELVQLRRMIEQQAVDLQNLNSTLLAQVTELSQTRAAHQRLGQLLEESYNEIYLYDADTLHFIDANTAALTNTGYTIDELREMTPLELKP